VNAGLRSIFSRMSFVCAAVIGTAELAVVFTRTSWIGLLGYTPEWSNAGLFLAAPLIAGASAFLAQTGLSGEVAAITGARTRRGATRVIVAAWLRVLVIALTTHLVVMLVALAVSAAFGASGDVTWEPFAYAAMPIAVSCAIGIALGAVLPHLWSAPLAIVVTYGMWYFAATTGAVLPVDVGGATISLAGLRYSASALAVLLLAASTATAIFLSVAVVALRWQDFTRSLTVFAGAVLCVTVTATAIGSRSDLDRFEPHTEVGYSCSGSDPRICLTAPHTARLDETAARIDAAARPFRAAGIDLSGLVVREVTGESRSGPEGVLLLAFGQLNSIGVRDADYAHALLRPTNCEDYFAPEMTPALDRLLAASSLLGDWIDARAAGAEPHLRDDQARQLYEGLRACSVTEASLSSVGVR
jgi:hypothetical protein